jgi:hypothetical protein
MKWLFAAAFVALVAVRAPSLVQPAGGDQGLYAYVGQSILRGELPYRDAWDQKPPGVHLTYAAMFLAWRDESVVAGTDLVVAAIVALLLVALGRRLAGRRGPGEVAAILFLLLGDPSFQRLGGLWVRSQAETFINLAVTGSLLICAVAAGAGVSRYEARRAFGWASVGGVLLGLAFLYKYNAGAYVLPAAAVLALGGPDEGRAASAPRRLGDLTRLLAALAAGFAVPVAATLVWFTAHGALDDLFQATIVYNVRYSGETYAGAWRAIGYLFAFPVRHAGVDALWFLGGAGCAVLTVASLFNRRLLVAPAWVAAACLSIAVNGSRDLPQYFVQGAPGMALAAGIGGVLVWRTLGPLPRVALLLLLAVGVARVNQFDKWAGSIRYDFDHVRGRTSRTDYLSKFGGQRPTDKFSALASSQLGDILRATTAPGDRVLVFGFSAGALVRAERRSASRFFWSRPLLVGFNEGRPGYGVSGFLDELRAARPAEVALQQRDWPAEGVDSATWFASQPALAAWLATNYRQAADTGTYFLWRRRDLL